MKRTSRVVMTGSLLIAFALQVHAQPWHGVTFVKAVNGRVVKPSYPFTYQDMTHQKVRQLYNRAGIADMEKKSKNELELISHISDWTTMQWGHMQPMPFPSADALELLDKSEKGDAFWCGNKATLFVQGCNAAGLTARTVGIRGHGVTEVYINDYRKWMLVDPETNCYYERDGIPLSAIEVHRAFNNPVGIFQVFGENGKYTEYWNYRAGKAADIPTANKKVPIGKGGWGGGYDIITIALRNDLTVHPQSGGPRLKWIDEKSMPQISTLSSGEINDFEWPLNEVKVNFMSEKKFLPGDPVVLEVKLSTLTPNFSQYRFEIDGGAVPIDGDTYLWKLKKGTNSLKVAAVNAVGKSGFPSEFILEYNPVEVVSRKVTVELKNPGMEEVADGSQDRVSSTYWTGRLKNLSMEEAAGGSQGRVAKPAQWGTITSNPLGFGEFTLDSEVKHSGKYAIKATPARDLKTGIEYAFIVRSANFDVTPGSNVIYTIWLRASKDDTPVDIAVTYQSEGTYAERVMVGSKWKKYELKCRLLAENTNAYVGFKVYTGTVWGDDADYVEVHK